MINTTHSSALLKKGGIGVGRCGDEGGGTENLTDASSAAREARKPRGPGKF